MRNFILRFFFCAEGHGEHYGDLFLQFCRKVMNGGRITGNTSIPVEELQVQDAFVYYSLFQCLHIKSCPPCSE